MICWRKCPIFHQEKQCCWWGFNLCFLCMPSLSSAHSNRIHSASAWFFTPWCISSPSIPGALEDAPMPIPYVKNFRHRKVKWLAKYTQRLRQSWTLCQVLCPYPDHSTILPERCLPGPTAYHTTEGYRLFSKCEVHRWSLKHHRSVMDCNQ